MRTFACVVVLAIVAAAVVSRVAAQTSSKPATPRTSAQGPPASETSAVAAASAEPALKSKLSPTEYPADYIPCVFTLRELFGLRLKPVSATLTSADEEDLKERLISEATAQANSGGMEPGTRSDFLTLIANESFEGLTASQALARVISILRRVYDERIPIDDLKYAAKAPTVDQLLNLAMQQLPMKILNSESSADSTKAKENLQRDVGDNMGAVDRLRQLSVNVSTMLQGLKYTYAEFDVPQELLIRNLAQAAKELETGDEGMAALQNQMRQQDVAIQAIVERARAGIAMAFQRPQDVGCAMSILSWNETRYAFGRIIANEYIGVQIVVRNLNDKQEFALHDAELSVDTDIYGRYGRFYSGRDKLVVRGLSLAQANFTPRNFTVHLAEAAGTVMSAALPIAGNAFRDAVAVYNGGFLPGLKSTWADHSVDQLNLLSDIGFSSSTNYKTVVPKSGSVMFVIFVPSKQFEEGWWVQSCAQTILIQPRSQTSSGTASSKAPSSTELTPYPLISQSQSSTHGVGVDLEAARQLCLNTSGAVPTTSQPQSANDQRLDKKPGGPQTSVGAKSDQQPGTPDTEGLDTNQKPAPLSLKDVPYRKWSPTSLGIFRELAWAVVAGTHVQQAQNQSAVSNLKCPVDDLGNLQFNKTGTLSCDVSGEGLDKVAILRLRNAQDATDTDTADGTVTVSGDPTAAKVSFQVSKLGGLKSPAYKVYAVTTTGVETFANQTVHLGLTPFESEVSPTTSDPSKQSTTQFSIKGFHLDKIAKVELFEGSYNKDAKPLLQYDPDSGGTTNQASFTLKSADDDLKKKATGTSGLQLQIAFTVKNSTLVVPADSIRLQTTAAATESAGSQQTQSVNPTGTGVAAASPEALTLKPKALMFGAQRKGTTSDPKTVTFTNSDTVPVTGLSVKIAGEHGNNFTATNTCGTIPAGGKCTLTVKFAPTAAGKLSATLNVDYSVGGKKHSQSISLEGTGSE